MALVPLGLAVGPVGLHAQDGLEDACTTAVGSAECRLAVATLGTIHPRLGLGLWGGNPIPGTANTAGHRIRRPRISVAGRVTAVPVSLPPLLDQSLSGQAGGLLTTASVQATVGAVHGFSPLPTVGGVFSLDLIGRVSAGVPLGEGFRDPAVWGVAAGVRLGLLRESFTLPGVSLTALYGRSSRLAFGDPQGLETDGAVEGGVDGLRATAAVSRWILGLRLAGGLSWDRYASDAVVRYRVSSAEPQAVHEGRAVMERWSGFGSITWRRLVYHTVLEVGWQEPPTFPGLPARVSLDPVAWWVGLSFRVTP